MQVVFFSYLFFIKALSNAFHSIYLIPKWKKLRILIFVILQMIQWIQWNVVNRTSIQNQRSWMGIEFTGDFFTTESYVFCPFDPMITRLISGVFL